MFDEKKKSDCNRSTEPLPPVNECICDDDDCDCECAPEEITLIGEDGEKMQFILLGVTKFGEKEYAALSEPDSNDFIVFEIRQADEYYEFLDIESDEEYNQIGIAFEKYFAEDEMGDEEPAAPPKRERAAKGKNDKSKPAKPAGGSRSGGAKSGRPRKR